MTINIPVVVTLLRVERADGALAARLTQLNLPPAGSGFRPCAVPPLSAASAASQRESSHHALIAPAPVVSASSCADGRHGLRRCRRRRGEFSVVQHLGTARRRRRSRPDRAREYTACSASRHAGAAGGCGAQAAGRVVGGAGCQPRRLHVRPRRARQAGDQLVDRQARVDRQHQRCRAGHDRRCKAGAETARVDAVAGTGGATVVQRQQAAVGEQRPYGPPTSSPPTVASVTSGPKLE